MEQVVEPAQLLNCLCASVRLPGDERPQEQDSACNRARNDASGAGRDLRQSHGEIYFARTRLSLPAHFELTAQVRTLDAKALLPWSTVGKCTHRPVGA